MTLRQITICSLALFVSVAGGWNYLQREGSGVSMSRAGNHFVSTLTDEQKQTAVLAYDVESRTDWHFIPMDERKGLQIKHMTDAQREAAHQLLKTCLSQVGYDKAVKIMQLEHILYVLEKGAGSNIRDTERYYFTVFGEPSEQGQWGLSIEGHHLSFNFVVENGVVSSSTPIFFAANPATVKSEVEGGQPAGTRVLSAEEQRGFDLVNSLTDEQFSKALIDEKAPREIRAPGEPQPPQEKPVGIALADLDANQREMLKQLVFAYLDNVPDDVRKQRLDAIYAAGPARVHFAWAGAKEPGIGHYYRIQGPTFLIEFVNTQPDAAGNPANHIHCVFRDMRGDFGISL